MGGDEKRASGTAVCDDATGGAEGGATTSGGVAPPSAAESADPEVGDDPTDADPLDPVDADQEPEALDAAVGDMTSDEPAAREPEVGEPVSDAPVPAEPEADDLDRDDPAAAVVAADAAPHRLDVDGAAPDGPGADGAAPDGTEPDERASPEDVAPSVGDASEPANAEAAPATRPRQLRPFLRRVAVALAAAGFVALGVGAFAWAAPSPEAADRRFVEAAQSQGHVVAPGDQQALVVSAARKICDRRLSHDTLEERRATALSADELAAVGAAFGAGTREFTALALKTYCSS